MDLSVVVAARNEELRLGEQLDALLAQQFRGEWEIVVVDNGSTDGTVRLVEEYAARHPRGVRLVLANERADKTYAMNKGVASSPAPLLAFTDADDVVAPGWLSAIAEGLDAHEVVTGPNLLDRLNPPWLAGSRGRGDEAPCGTFAGIFPTVRGNNFGVRTSTWQRLGGIREGSYPCEDLEFSLRCWMNGIEVVGIPQAVVHYRYRESPKELWRQGFAYGSQRPRIARLLKEAGGPVPPRWGGWKSWIILILRLPTVVTRPGRARWLWIAGNRLGQVVGSVKYRTLML